MTDLEGRANRATAERYYDELVALFERRRVTTSPGTTRVDVPTRAEVADAWASAGRDPGRVWRTNAEWMGKLAAAALHADVTRVATIRMLQPDRSLYGFTGDWHEDIQHPASQAFPPNGTLLGRATAFEALKVGALVGLLRELESRREPDGTTLLDNTVVVVCGEIGDGWHRDHDMPWFVIGDAHGYFRTGRAITYPRYGLTSAKARDTSREIRRATDGSSVGSYRYNSISRSNNDLFVTLAQAMGMSDVRSFGLGAVNYGAMTELRGG
ncbi:MAG: hypothetical protein R3B99_00745 [Polyangiales bacterium]